MVGAGVSGVNVSSCHVLSADKGRMEDVSNAMMSGSRQA